ncbi:MAG: peptidoglycan DD-metalloendopeptidase family protein [Steroidobacteraceae bacterium]|nr:peptidoglycan DD-metalloendopeptidase family protein [Steroidobacteraceae bacterium]
MRASPRTSPSALVVLLACAGLAAGLPAPTPAQSGRTPASQGRDGPDRARTEAELRQIQREIERVREQVSRDAAERDRLQRDLRRTEQSVSGVRGEMSRLRREREARNRRRAELARERGQREAALAREREALAAQLRAAHQMGRAEPLRLLLNQRDPAKAGRMFAYYGYFGRARAGQIAGIEQHVARIAELDAELAGEEARLVELERSRNEELAKLEQARSERGQVLANLKAESRSRAAQLQRLQRQQAALEKLLRELRRTIEKFPSDSKGAFAQLRGKLAWPAAGRVVARYGETRAGGLRWDGMLFAVERGAPVRAVYHGRVVYADWLAGLGLLVIVDHGGGYLSLYGHNDELYRKVGERVTAGDPVAAAGDSGGRTQPELYFALRRGGRAIDPRPWFRNARP